MRHLFIATVLLLLTLSAYAEGDRQTLVAQAVDSEYPQMRDLTLSRDGSQAIAVVDTEDPSYLDYQVGRRHRQLLQIELANGETRPLTEPAADAHQPAVSHDGRQLAYFAWQQGTVGVVVHDLASDQRRRLSEVVGNSRNPVGLQGHLLWSVDGRSVVYAVQPEPGTAERMLARYTTAPADLKAPIVVPSDHPLPQLAVQGVRGPAFGPPPAFDIWRAGLDGTSHRLARGVPANGQLLAANADSAWWAAGTSIWRQQGTESAPEPAVELPGFVRSASQRPDGDIVLLLQELPRTAPGQPPTLGAPPTSTWLTVTWRPGDGEIEQLARGRAAAREPSEIGLHVVAPSHDGQWVFGRRQRATAMELIAFGLANGNEIPLLSDGWAGRGMAELSDATLLIPQRTAELAEQLLRIDPSRSREPQPQWSATAALAPGKVEQRTWRVGDATIEGLLVLPTREDSSAPYPTLLYLHGGPEWASYRNYPMLVSPCRASGAHLFAAAGYAVLMPNFRGSDGYGAKHRQALAGGRLFETPVEDSLAGLQALIDEGLADPRRLGVYGHSFGGSLTAWLTGRDHRFKAAIAAVGVFDSLASDRSTPGGFAFHAMGSRSSADSDPFDHWRNPEKYRQLSPMETASQVRTPTLLISTAAEQVATPDHAAYFHALQISQTPVQWLYYPGAFHSGSWRREDRGHCARHMLDWMDRFVLAEVENSSAGEKPAAHP